MLRPQQGHPQGSFQCTNKRMAQAIEDMHMWSPNITLYIKTAKNIYNTDYLPILSYKCFAFYVNICFSLQKTHISTLSSFLWSYPFTVSRRLHHGASIGTLLFITHLNFGPRQAR